MQTKTSMNIDNQRILMGNEALGRGIVEAGVSLAASYPGPSARDGISPLF
jgi:TPP-dependent indolepyruvate ferredoxin oxidoreductase alpha subunit